MTSLDAIRNRARADLILVTKQGTEDVFLWEHSDRVARNAQGIAGLAETPQRQPDESALVAAALYHDAGWAARVRDGEIEHTEILSGPCSQASREKAATMAETSLADLLPAESLERASRAIRALGDRDIESIEGVIVREADNLDEFGLLSLWPIIRRGATDGKGVQAAIEKWRRQKEYQFWTARLNEFFRFASVREVAKRRLEQFERFMEELDEQHDGRDVLSTFEAEAR